MGEDLQSIQAKIDAAAAKVVALKKSGGDVDAIKATVAELIAAKTAYANANDGKLADGTPFDPNASKKDKKKKKKDDAQKAANAAANAPTAESLAKKEAKKAEKAAKKAAAKAAAAGNGGSTPPAPKGGKAPEKVTAAAAAAAPPRAPPAKVQSKKKARPIQFGKVEPMQLIFSPNPGAKVPFVTILAATMTALDPDLKYKMDSRRTTPALGTHGTGTTADRVIQGDISCVKYFLRSHPRQDLTLPLLGGSDFKGQSEVDEWIEYVLSCKGASSATNNSIGYNELLESINTALSSNNTMYLCGSSITLADIVAFGALNLDPKVHPCSTPTASFPSDVARWFSLIDSNPATLKARHLLCSIDGSTEFPADDVLEPLASGCHFLEGAIPFEVCTRFPPEPSGYLHIGHAKAVLLNDYYARRYKGRLIVRFDDTNPSKEKEEFQQSIVEDLKKLGVFPDVVTYTSDYFAQLKSYAEWLIDAGLAFMDDTPQEEMQKERMARQNSKRRDMSVEENRKYFDLMGSGDAEGAKWCLRAKVNMQSVNGTMRDPVIFRQNLTPHHRSGTTYKAYPTYDLACPIVDSVEGVTHALRTTEYNDRDEQYAWFQNALKLRRVRIHGFARMNFMYTELSKRKLTWFVENGQVTGWDDPRFPTVRGVVRRGVNVEALRGYILSQGASRRITLMEWNKFWAVNKKEIDDRAKRFMVVSKEGATTITLTNAADPSKNVHLNIDAHPKFPEVGKRLLKISNKVMVEASDVDGVEVGENIVLSRWGVVKVTKVEGGIEGEHVPDGDLKACKRKLTWLSESNQNIDVKLFEFDNLINKPALEEGENFKDFINENNLAHMVVTGDAGMRLLKQDEVIQIERRGLYRVDKVHGRIGNSAKGGSGVGGDLGEEGGGLVLFMIPDGKSKAMSTLGGKLEHR